MEDIAAWCIKIWGRIPPPCLKKTIFIFASDHGVVEEQVSAYPKEVTAQMVYNFLQGGAAINVLARHIGAELQVVDMGVDHDFKIAPGLLCRKISYGTRNMVLGPAMSRAQAERALLIGIQLAQRASLKGVHLIGAGDMGIGNTTASSAITTVMTKASVELVTGKGTGVNEQGLLRKQMVIQKALKINFPNSKDPLDVLSKVGGFEIGGIVGLILGSAAHRIPVVIDGFITTSAALLAVALKPETREYLCAGHRSSEPGHQIALNNLGLNPLLDLNMRLGEGSGAALAMGIVEASLKIFNEMATFEQAGVSKAGKRK
jgi:nicotinate-nucleotide--dimethylbenzimidazole phosphoribosyltransferase